MIHMIDYQNSMSQGQLMNALSDKKDREAFRNKEKKIDSYFKVTVGFAFVGQLPVYGAFIKDVVFGITVMLLLFLIISFSRLHLKMMKYHK